MRLLKFLSKRKFAGDFSLILLLLILSSWTWRFLLQEIIRGGGYVYLTSHFQTWWWSRPLTFTGFQSAAIISSGISLKLFGINMSLYFLAEIFILMLINVLFYLLVRTITKNSLIAFAAALIFAVNYFGNFDIIMACYCYLGERIIVVPFLLTSLIFLHLFLEKSKKIYFFISLSSYFLGVGLGHFSVLFTAPFLFYPFFWYVFNHKKKGEIIKGALVGLFYLGLSGFFIIIQQINESGLNNDLGIFQYLINPGKYHYFEYMLRQLTYWSQYPPIIDAFLAGHLELQNVPSVINAIQITPYIAIVYLLVSIFIYKKIPKQRALLFTVIFATATIFWLNPWFGQYVVSSQAGTNRYLYFPTFLLAIFWSLFLWAAFWKKLWKLLIGIFILVTYYVINLTLISNSFAQRAWENEPTKAIISHFVSMRKNLAKNTLVVGSYPAITLYESIFFTEQIGKGEVMFVSDDDPYTDWRKIASSSAHVIKLTYDRKCQCVEEEKIK